MLSCKDLVKSAPHYLEGQVSFLKRLEYWLHLALCHNCRRYLRQLTRAFDFIRPQLARTDPPEAMKEKLLQELELRLKKETSKGIQE